MARATFGGYTNITQVIATTAAARIQAEIAKFEALVVDGITNPSGVKTPEFDHIHPALADQFRVELTALKAAIAAAPTA